MAVCCKRRRKSDILSNSMELMNNSATRMSTLENSQKYTRKEPKIPTWLCILAIVAYISCFACILSLYHAWNFVDSFYFAFSVLGTIGLPDSQTGSEETGFHVAMCTFYILSGLAILAMAGILIREDRGWCNTRFMISTVDADRLISSSEKNFTNKMPNDQNSSWVYNSR